MNKNTAGYIAIVILLCITSFFSINLFFKEKTSRDKTDITSFPLQIGGWKGRDLTTTEKEYKILETRNLVSREYANSKNERLYLFIIYSETNRLVFHPPEVCMIGSGSEIVDKEVEKISYGKGSFSANKLYTEYNGRKSIALYAYKAGRIYTDNFYLQQAYLAFRQIFGNAAPGATIRVVMPLGQDETATLETLKNFLGKTADIVDSLAYKR